ncbi:MAG TPA: hypothetical protein G4O02_02865 [Caldilineae bacterium]|jgi:hypothetical protein|nr:hypothetical protein [Caldilineae bacterium]
MEHDRRGTIVPGLFLIILGLWFLFRNLGLPGFRAFWPLFIILAGMGAWGRYVMAGTRRQPDDVFWGTVLFLVGMLFLVRENGWIGLATRDWDVLWPIFPAIIGTGAGAQWLLHPRRRHSLLWSLAGWLVALFGFSYTLGLIPEEAGLILIKLWPSLLILIGLGLVLQSLLEGWRRTS